MRTIKGIEELKQLAGQELGSGDWHEVTQEQINQFADATGDHQWIHTDVERAKKGPFGGPIAHGYFTLSIIPVLLRDVMSVEGMRMGINYGLNKLRFPAPVPIPWSTWSTTRRSGPPMAGGCGQATRAISFWRA